jgi:hypothetical protein
LNKAGSLNTPLLPFSFPRSIKRRIESPTRSLRKASVLVWVSIFAVLIGLTACSQAELGVSDSKTASSSTGTSGDNNLSLLTQKKGCSVRLYGLMTFDAFNQDWSWPTEFKLPPIAITWMGPIFNGRLETVGQGSAIYEVHGGASADGNWIESMYYSVNTSRSAQLGVFYRVTLRNIPLNLTSNSVTSWTPIFEMSGSEVQKYAAKIEYAGANTYVSTDWQTKLSGHLPELKLEFIKEQPVQTGAQGGGGGM